MLIFLSRFLPLSGIQACIHWDFLSLRHGHNGLWEVPALNQPVQLLTTRLYSDLRLSDTLFSCSSDWSWAKGKMHASGRWERSNRHLSWRFRSPLCGQGQAVWCQQIPIYLCSVLAVVMTLQSASVLRQMLCWELTEMGATMSTLLPMLWVPSHSRESKLSGPLPCLNSLCLCITSSPPFGRSKSSMFFPQWCREFNYHNDFCLFTSI